MGLSLTLSKNNNCLFTDFPDAYWVIRDVMYSTTYGGEAFYEYLVWYGVIIFGALIPVFPAMIFWQILYIIKRIQYRKKG